MNKNLAHGKTLKNTFGELTRLVDELDFCGIKGEFRLWASGNR